MAEIRWTEQALNDVDAIADYIARDSSHYARLFVQKIFMAVNRLYLFPESGRIVPETGRNEIREIILGNYRIIYRTRSNLVEILAIYHSARLLDTRSIISDN